MYSVSESSSLPSCITVNPNGIEGRNNNNIQFRSIRPTDFQVIKQLHEDFFPVRYSDSFYYDACQGIGVNNCQLFTCLAVRLSSSSSQYNRGEEEDKDQGVDDEDEDEVIGFIFAQFIPYSECEDQDIIQHHQSFPFDSNRRTYDSGDDDECLNNNHNQHTSSYTMKPVSELFYILTLGVKAEYRRSGLASQLLSICIQQASSSSASSSQQHAHCGAVYLHVIHNNSSAIAFYEKNGFVCHKISYDFYHINEAYHNALLYVYYINGYQAPPPTAVNIITTTAIEVYHSIVKQISEAVVTISSSFISAFGFFPTVIDSVPTSGDANDHDYYSPSTKV